jgi:CheY-like chemotaxis protein
VDATTEVKRPADVLVIDDDEIMRDLVADWLEAAGYGVRKAADGPAGLAEVERVEPALVVTDMCMPGPSGGVIIRALRQDHPAIPIVAISGYFSLSGCTAADALDLGAARALAKPVKRGEIMQAVAELVGPPSPAGRTR